MHNMCPGVNLCFYLNVGKTVLLNFKYVITENNACAE